MKYSTKYKKSQSHDCTNPTSKILDNKYSHHLNSTLVLNVEHEVQSWNRIPASNLEKGWIIGLWE